MSAIIEIKRVPQELRVKPIEHGEIYPRLILEMEYSSSVDFIILDTDAKIILEKERDNGRWNIIPDNLVKVLYGSLHPRDRLLITREEWCDRILKPLGANDRFIFELPCKLPTIAQISTEETDITELKNRIVRAIDLLREAMERYNTTKDVGKTVDDVRRITDLLHHIPNKDALLEIYGKFLIEKSATGTENICKDIIEDIFRIIRSLYNISSKGPHETTRRGERMEYHPNDEDADALFAITAFVCYFLATKFERVGTIAQR